MSILKNLVYFGSPQFSAQILESIILSKLVSVVGVVTTPDTPQGRKQVLTSSSVAEMASKYDLPIYKPIKLDDSNLAHIKLLKPDIFLVVSFGKIVPPSWLSTPNIGTFNIHFSLLPKYRGALCISEAIKNQDKETGVTLMEMDDLLDHGAIISQSIVPIKIDDNVSTLTTKLTQAASVLLQQKLPEICAQKYTSVAQDESLATFTLSHKTQTHQNAYIPWEDIKSSMSTDNQKLPSKIHALVRSLTPEPGAWTTIPLINKNTLDIKILRTSLAENKLVIDQVQVAGKQPTAWKQFLAGHSVEN